MMLRNTVDVCRERLKHNILLYTERNGLIYILRLGAVGIVYIGCMSSWGLSRGLVLLTYRLYYIFRRGRLEYNKFFSNRYCTKKTAFQVKCSTAHNIINLQHIIFIIYIIYKLVYLFMLAKQQGFNIISLYTPPSPEQLLQCIGEPIFTHTHRHTFILYYDNIHT